MKGDDKKYKNKIVVLLFLSLLLNGKGFSQISGALFMLPDNFYAQMYNPAYMRNDKAIEISVAGLAGFSFLNQGNFKISDIIRTNTGSPVIDPEHFNGILNTNNFIRQKVAVPVAFLSFPTKRGNFNFYYKENFSSVLKFNNEIIDFFINGNYYPEHKQFNSGPIKLMISGYREFSFGYAKKINKKLHVGFHAKALFGAALVHANNWYYGIETSLDGFNISFLSKGTGNISLPATIELWGDSTIYTIKSEKLHNNYFKEYKNPGFAVDLGATYQLNKKDKMSVSIRDLGAIWYKHNAYKLNKNLGFEYIGFDLVHEVRFPEEQGYTNPVRLIHLVKDSLRNFWNTKAVEKSFAFGLAPKTVLHYQHNFSDILSMGVTNQSAFLKYNFQNVLTLSAMQSWPNLSVFESVNLHGVNNISVGGGIQYEGNFAQFFLATDNLIAFYHPANNKTFTLMAGICILLNHKKEIDPESNNKGIKKRKGTISPELPYYKKLRKL